MVSAFLAFRPSWHLFLTFWPFGMFFGIFAFLHYWHFWQNAKTAKHAKMSKNSPNQKWLKAKFRTVIIQYFISKLLSKLILDHRKCLKEKTCTLMRFPVGALPEVKNQFESSFLTKCYIITVLNVFWAFRSVFKNVKNGFPIKFSNLAQKCSGV